MIIKYNNKYGYVEIETIENCKTINKIHSKNYNDKIFFDMNIAEKIALITENKNIQCVVVDLNKVFLVYHYTKNMGSVCKLNKIEFNNKINHTKELECLNNIMRLKI